MKTIFCVTLCLIVVNLEVNSSVVDVAEKSEEFNEDYHKTALTTLNEDCLFLIFEHLDFGDLLNMAQIIDKLSTVTDDVFRFKHLNTRFVVQESFSLPDELRNQNYISNLKDTIFDTETFERLTRDLSLVQNKTQIIKESKNKIELGDYNSILSTFKCFGHLIKKFNSESFLNVPDLQIKLIGYLISEYSSESLMDIVLAQSSHEVLKYITKPLINVENVTIRENYSGEENPIIGFGELFPIVRRLDLTFLIDSDLSYFDCHMPHLEDVSIYKLDDNSPIPELIRKNPQIRSFGLMSSDFESLRNVSSCLPQLEKLAIVHLEAPGQENAIAQFENVTTFIFGENTIPTHFQFSRLQTLHMTFSSDRFFEHRTFLDKHSNLRHLHLMFKQINDLQFQRLTENLDVLLEITLNRYDNEYVDELISPMVILEFLRIHGGVKRVNVIGLTESFEAELQKLLKNEWNMEDFDGGLTFKRVWNNQL